MKNIFATKEVNDRTGMAGTYVILKVCGAFVGVRAEPPFAGLPHDHFSSD